jgi:ABC-type Fe3+/spermidine/putrescine transport system ATPase subunit
VRPECTRISRQANGQTHSAVVTRCVFLGSSMHVETRLKNGVVALSEIPANGDHYQEGEPVHIWWDSNDELSFPE